MSPPKVAFISGHTDLSQEDFDEHYLPQIESAIDNNDTFIFGDASGVDEQCLSHFLNPSNSSAHTIDPKRITIYCSSINHITKFQKLGLNVISPKDTSLEPTSLVRSLVQIKDKGRNRARFKHLSRDTWMTLNSDYDILWVRSEDESRAFYGTKWRPRISATELNRQRRENLKAIGEGRDMPFIEGKDVRGSGEVYVGSTAEENEEVFRELPGL